ncbi:Aste57867_24043 [Aphanomyces stellatus]|uniref:Aste57867_24043 protein n=1 Tax=Aphanomyces stellatus TaxID=120398 RepID=A0A485LPE4_9STRA|nr:hypothetical protein As57867_023970 [Aphanomyces stellatus]VFU00686.1 Aste57867_24043 [Aphanomyces stellatus]
MPPAACPRPECTAMEADFILLKKQHNELVQEKTKWEADRASANEVIATLMAQNEELNKKLNKPPPSSDAPSPVHDVQENVQAKWEEAVQREHVLSEKLHRLEMEIQDATRVVDRRVEELTAQAQDKARELAAAHEEVAHWKKEHAEMRSAMDAFAHAASGAAPTSVAADIEAAHKAAMDVVSTKVHHLEEEKHALEQKLLDMEATNAAVDTMILDFKAKFEVERQGYLGDIQEWKRRATDATTTTGVVGDLEHKMAILNEMRVQDKETLTDLRRALAHKDIEMETYRSQYVHKDSWRHVESQLSGMTQQNELLRQDVELYKTQVVQLQAALAKASVPPSSSSTTDAAPKEPHAKQKKHPTQAVAAAAATTTVLVDTKAELEEQIQVGLELDVCLEEATTLFFENQQLVHKLTTLDAALVGVQDQEAVLYRAYIGQQHDFAARTQQLEAAVATAQTTVEELTIKLHRYETMWQSIQVQSEWQHVAADTTRKLALFEVNQARLARQYNVMMDEKQTEYTRRIAIEDELLDVEKALKGRIQYLESWKQGATRRIKSMQQALHQSILKRDYDVLVDAYDHLQVTYARHLDRWTDLHATYVASLDVVEQNAHLLHENAVLRAHNPTTVAALQNERIEALETTLRTYVAKLQEAAAAPPPPPPQATHKSPPTAEMTAVLEQRIAELEQCCTALEHEVAKEKAIASLAASQANTLSQRQTRHRDDVSQLEERVRELASRSDDDAIIGQLQQKLLTIQANYHSFTDRYEKAMEMHRAAQLQVNTLTLQMDAAMESHAAELERERQSTRVLETALATLRQSDVRSKIKRLEAMSTRIQSLEEEVVQLQAKKRALERRVEELESGQEGGAPHDDDGHALQRYKHRIAILEQKEKMWLEQMEQLTQSNNIAPPKMTPTVEADKKSRQERQALQAKLDQALFEMDGLKTKCSKVLQESSQKDVRVRELEMQVDNLALEVQMKPTSDAGHAPPTLARTPSSPSMRNKVGYYEKDHVALQEAAQATIASLKALVADKNHRIDEYQRQLEKLRDEYEAKQRAAHDDQERRNRRLYEDNHAYIAQLKDAMEKIHQLEAQGGGKAVVAAREMHDGLLEQLKQVHMEVELKGQIVHELQSKVDTLRHAKQTAEARCGEALEEIAALQKVNHALVDEMEAAQKDKARQTLQWKTDLAAKDKKMALLRDAIIKLKEEFLKAQEQQAEESVREKRQQTNHDDDRVDELTEKNSQLTAKCTMLQEKTHGLTEDLEALTKKYKRVLAASKPKVSKESQDMKAAVSDLREELARCKAKLGTYHAQEQEMDALHTRVKVLEAKNAALRQEAAEPAEPARQQTASTNQEDEPSHDRRRMWEQEKKLKRRVETLAARLDEKAAEVERLTTQCQRLSEQYQKLQDHVKSQQHQQHQQRELPLPHGRAREDAVELDNCYRRIVALQQQVLDARQTALAQLETTPSVDERVQRETQMLELSFQVESLQIELHRVRQSSTAMMPPSSSSCQMAKGPEKREPTVAALEDVIENMKRVMEKLRSENERLRKHVKPAAASTTTASSKQVKEQMAQLTAAHESTKAELARLRQEHTDLARKFRALGAKYKALKATSASSTTTTSYVADMEQLHAMQLREKDMQIHALQQDALLRQSASPRAASANVADDNAAAWRHQIDRLIDENKRLKHELSAFDEDFFDEIEDLKFKYTQAVRDKQALERQLVEDKRLPRSAPPRTTPTGDGSI